MARASAPQPQSQSQGARQVQRASAGATAGASPRIFSPNKRNNIVIPSARTPMPTSSGPTMKMKLTSTKE